MNTFIEPRVRHLVADTLGVGLDVLSPDVSLVDDLAADSLDLAELAVRLEADLGITVPDRVLERLRTYGDFVHMTRAALRDRRAPVDAAPYLPLTVRTRLVSPRGELVRAEVLGPYVTETLVDDALRAGSGARLEVTVDREADDETLAELRGALAWLGEHGVTVKVEREDVVQAGLSHEAA